jgi:putative glycosyltransferase (TIGR04348 family)
MRTKPSVCIVTPALASANNGNWHTARRWQEYLLPLADVEITLAWNGRPVDALIALHARRSADSIARFAHAHADRPLALVLTGTDIYRDIDSDASAAASLSHATHLVVLQEEALQRLGPAQRERARVIVQSATRRVMRDKALTQFDLVAIGHLRAEKDPLTMMHAVRLLPAESAIRFLHIGDGLDESLADAARRTMHECPRYQWLGGLAPADARRRLARARALVHASVMEGGANVVIEAVRSRVPVLASRIDGNVGLLGRDYDGYFAAGDAAALAALMRRFETDREFAQRLAHQCALREPLFTPEAERARVQRLLADMLASKV